MVFLFKMSTIYSRIKHYCLHKKCPIPTKDQRAEIGKGIAHIYFEEGKSKFPIVRVESIEPEGTFQVLSYPKAYNEVIDKFIDDYMVEVIAEKNAEKPRERKRKPVQKPVYRQNRGS